MVLRKGDARGGAVLVKVANRRNGQTRLYAKAVRFDGEDVWMEPVSSADETDIDGYIERSARIDPDIWVVEIDDGEGRHFITDKVETR